jgi:hypothetical protein
VGNKGRNEDCNKEGKGISKENERIKRIKDYVT